MKNILLALFLMTPVVIFSQTVRGNEDNVLNLGIDYGFQIQGGDLKSRFGNSTGLGGKLEFLFKNNLSLSVDGTFTFGRKVKEDPLLDLKDSDGLFIGNNFSQANVFLRHRGFYLGGSVGKLFPVLKNNKRSGIKLDLGVGLFQHKIRIQEDPESFVPIVAGTYKKGYDRLTNGLALRQFIGYQHLAKNRLLNFYIGVDIVEGFTQNRRTYNFDTMAADETKRFDIQTTFKIGWILPFYVGDTGEDISY